MNKGGVWFKNVYVGSEILKYKIKKVSAIPLSQIARFVFFLQE